MLTLARLISVSITMYAADHLPPHFHVRSRDGREALVDIATLQILRGHLRPRELAEVIAWARDSRVLLGAKWKELNP